MRFANLFGWFLLLLAAPTLRVSAQDCKPPLVEKTSVGANIFSPQQEIDLGDIQAEQLPRHLRISDDPVLTAFLNRIGQHLTDHLPAAQLTFRYFLVDSAEPDAFAIAGGRIYITRGMIAFLRNEGEIAGVIAHEMGHIITHQQAIETSTLLREVLGVTQVSSKRDILVDLTRLRENWRHNPGAFERVQSRSEGDQAIADQVALYAMTMAGYRADTYAETFDRVARTRGKTGNWLTDLLHTTPPDQHRLKTILASLGSLPAACSQHPFTAMQGGFRAWQESVLNYSGWEQRRQDLHDVLSTVKLEPLLLWDVARVRFSPNGKYILAQESDRIHILTREPLAYLFHVDERNIIEARFTADSSAVAITSPGPRVEAWDLATRQRVHFYNLLERACVQTALSPDAKSLACIDAYNDLDLIDLVSQNDLLKREAFSKSPEDTVKAHLAFSPDGRYLLAASTDSVMAFDLTSRQSLALPRSMKSQLSGGFAFLGPDRLIVSSGVGAEFGPAAPGLSQEIKTLSFPDGKVIDTVSVRFSAVSPASNGNFAVLSHIGPSGAIGILDLGTKNVRLAFKQGTADVYDDFCVHSMPDGSIGVFGLKTKQLLSQVNVPSAGEFSKGVASPNLQWLAACGSHRCALWNANTGSRLHVMRSFNSAWFDGDQTFYADFAKFENSPRAIGRVDLVTDKITTARELDTPLAVVLGRFQIVSRIAGGRNDAVLLDGITARLTMYGIKVVEYTPSNVTLEIDDSVSGRTLWSRLFPKEGPKFVLEPEEELILLRWHTSMGAVSEEIKALPGAPERLTSNPGQNDVDFLEVVNATTGKVMQTAYIDAPAPITIIGDRVIASHRDYMEIYSLKRGQKEGEISGTLRGYSKTAGLIVAREEHDNELALYDLDSCEKVDEFAFPGDVDLVQFSADGKRLFVLTSDETGYVLNPSLARQSAPTEKP